ncbi:hypothetical protein [Prolixibacter bellariivorans]|nr:hypothetical protein [Prolixibacter bellariivorans]
MMRKTIIPFIFLVFAGYFAQAQDAKRLNGKVSYISAQHVYVRFTSTDGIDVGDTLYVEAKGKRIPGLVVVQRSSISCVTTVVGNYSPKMNDVIQADIKAKASITDEKKPVSVPKKPLAVIPQPAKPQPKLIQEKSRLYGRVKLASYSNFSNTDVKNQQRMRYTLSLNQQNIGNSNLSFDSYISYNHRTGGWNTDNQSIFNSLKIYSLAVGYNFSKNTSLWFGRKMNTKVSNIGAIDGLQFETRVNNFTFGVIGGARPDYMDYGVNTNLPQFGAYVSHEAKGKVGTAQSSLAVFEQMNGSHTDRRFIYIQHSNSLLKDFNLFTSVEMDLYQVKDSVPTNTLDLTSFYISSRYRASRKVSFYASYDARKNVIYYETYKTLVDLITDNATRQGVRFRVMVRPINYLIVSAQAGYRSRKGDPDPSTNYNFYITHSKIPWLKSSMTLNVTKLKTSYLDGLQYGGNLSKYLLNGKLYGSLSYRIINYNFLNSSSGINQNLAGCSFAWYIMKKLQLSMNYEATIEKSNVFHRMYWGLSQRF